MLRWSLEGINEQEYLIRHSTTAFNQSSQIKSIKTQASTPIHLHHPSRNILTKPTINPSTISQNEQFCAFISFILFEIDLCLCADISTWHKKRDMSTALRTIKLGTRTQTWHIFRYDVQQIKRELSASFPGFPGLYLLVRLVFVCWDTCFSEEDGWVDGLYWYFGKQADGVWLVDEFITLFAMGFRYHVIVLRRHVCCNRNERIVNTKWWFAKYLVLSLECWAKVTMFVECQAMAFKLPRFPMCKMPRPFAYLLLQNKPSSLSWLLEARSFLGFVREYHLPSKCQEIGLSAKGSRCAKCQDKFEWGFSRVSLFVYHLASGCVTVLGFMTLGGKCQVMVLLPSCIDVRKPKNLEWGVERVVCLLAFWGLGVLGFPLNRVISIPWSWVAKSSFSC